MTDRHGLMADLHHKFLPDLPKTVAAKVFDKAWEDGHANGEHEVAMHYEEIAEIAKAAFEAGHIAGWTGGMAAADPPPAMGSNPSRGPDLRGDIHY